jgi:outer membrane protein assembly factor BamA
MSDMLGDRRFIAALDSVSSFSNFDFLYFDLQHRLNWGVRLFDNRSFFTAPNFESGRVERIKQDYRETGLMGILSYPFNRYHRADFGAGYMSRQIAYPFLTSDGNVAFFERKDNFPLISGTFTGDNTAFKFFGPISGRRYELSATYAPDIKGKGTLSADYTMDWREYYQLSSRTLLAARVFGGYSNGNLPNLYYFGGLNTLRGYEFRSIVGNRAFFGNFEFRFPLIDLLVTPVLAFQQIRGELFFDIGAANYNGINLDTGTHFKFLNGGKLQDGRAAVGYGVSFDFLGLELHWDFAKRFDLRQTDGKFRTSFWIGETF